MTKSSDAFRTISEVSDLLSVPKHVLRFWEARFPQLKPMKRGGGRRFYRPEELELLTGIRHLLHEAGYTIKGVQKIIREQGVEAVKRHGRSEGVATAPPAAAGPAKALPEPGDLQAALLMIVAELDTCLALARPSRSTAPPPQARSRRQAS